MKRLYLLAIALLVAVTVVSCGLLGDSPDAGAREIMNSMVSGDFDRIRGRVCTARAGEIRDDQINQAKEQFKQVAGQFKVDTSAVNFSSEVNGDNATVTVSGRVKVEAQGQSRDFNIDDAPAELRKIKMVREGGTWKICPDTPSLGLPGF